MAEIAEKDGIDIIVATPHVQTGVFNNPKLSILHLVRRLNDIITAKNLNLSILPGAEYRLEADLPQRMRNDELLTLNNNGQYLLVELPSNLIPPYTENILYEIQLQGIIPIIAHPERNAVISRRPDFLYSLVERGMLTQITSTSLVGSFGKKAQKSAWTIISHGAGHVLGSDGHSPTGRAPFLSEAYRLIERRYGKPYANSLVHDNAVRILSGELISALRKPQKQYSWRGPWGL